MHKCKKCEVEIDMHLADFSTGPEEVDVYCEKHIPEDISEGVVWEYGDQDPSEAKVFIKSKTKNAKENWEGNHPNFLNLNPIKIFEESYPIGKVIKSV